MTFFLWHFLDSFALGGAKCNEKGKGKVRGRQLLQLIWPENVTMSEDARKQWARQGTRKHKRSAGGRALQLFRDYLYSFQLLKTRETVSEELRRKGVLRRFWTIILLPLYRNAPCCPSLQTSQAALDLVWQLRFLWALKFLLPWRRKVLFLFSVSLLCLSL